MPRTFNPTLRSSLSEPLSSAQVDANFAGVSDIANAASITYFAASQVAMLALFPVPQAGDICYRSDIPASYVFLGGDSTNIVDWSFSVPVPSVFGRAGAVVAQSGDYGVAQVTGALASADLASTSDVAKGDALLGVKQPFTGAVARTGHAKNQEFVSVQDFGATGDGATNDSAAIQAAINTGKGVYVPNGTYRCANILMRSGLHIYGESHDAVLKLVDNALMASYNGGVADSNGYYPGNVLCSTLIHDGGAYYDAGVRARCLDNSADPNEFIFKDILIENLTLDGNKANNQVGDLQQNRSAMGSCVSIYQCKNVTVQKCRLINARLDGIAIGYTPHGGSDYCKLVNNHFEGNQRTNIAQMTGKHNTIAANTGKQPTGGTGVTIGSALDIEPNWAGEVDCYHVVSGNNLGGSLSMVSVQPGALVHGCAVSGNTWVGTLALNPEDCSGSVIHGDTFIGTDTTDWLEIRGVTTPSTAIEPVVIEGCSALGFNRVLLQEDHGGQVNTRIVGLTYRGKAFGTLSRAYRFTITGSSFTFTGNTDTDTIKLSMTLGGTISPQGEVVFRGNRFRGVSNTNFLNWARDTSWTTARNNLVFAHNDIDVTGHTYQVLATTGGITFDSNTVNNFKPIHVTTSFTLSSFSKNEVYAATTTEFVTNTGVSWNFTNIDSNKCVNVNISVNYPLDSTICKNRLLNGNVYIAYTTADALGRNVIAHNELTATATIAVAYQVATGGSFVHGINFVGKDNYYYNTANGAYTAKVSISAALDAGSYEGAFV